MRNNANKNAQVLSSNLPMRAGLLSAVARAGSVMRATLQEIFDESAYKRFLLRTQLKSSRSAYKLFQQENEQSKSRKPRCC
jgi:hypothetical protein